MNSGLQRGGILKDFGKVTVYTAIFKKVNRKDLLYSTRNYAQCFVAAWMGGEFGGK